MANVRTFMKSGHPPTLLASFFYFDFCFAVWVLNGAMAPFITKAYGLSTDQTTLMVTLPTMAGALMRFPLGVMSQYIGRKNAALVEMATIMVAMGFGYFYVNSFNGVLAMGVLLGIAGASFGVALALGSGWFPPESKGLAMGIAGAGNSGTAIATFFAPQLAKAYGWHAVYGFAGMFMLLPFLTMLLFAKEPPDREGDHSFVDHIKCLWQPDGWMFNAIYVITFGAYVGMGTYLPTFFHDRFGIEQSEAKYYTTLAVLAGSLVRVFGGWLADRLGGILAVSVILSGVVAAFLGASFANTLPSTVVMLVCCFTMVGMGNGALFQLVPLRWPATAAVAGSMIGEIGALGGVILPFALTYSHVHYGTYAYGFMGYAALAALVLVALRIVQRYWVGKWIAPGGRALAVTTPAPGGVPAISGLPELV